MNIKIKIVCSKSILVGNERFYCQKKPNHDGLHFCQFKLKITGETKNFVLWEHKDITIEED